VMSPDTGAEPSVTPPLAVSKLVPSAFVDVATIATVGGLGSENTASVAGVLAVFWLPALSVKLLAATPISSAAAAPDTAEHVTVTTQEVASSHDEPDSVKVVASQLVFVVIASRLADPIGSALKPITSVMVNVKTIVAADVGTVLSVAVSEKEVPSALVPTALVMAMSGGVVSSHVLAVPEVIWV